MKKLLSLLVVLFVVSMASMAYATVSLYSAVGATGALAGGVRADITDALFVQVAADGEADVDGEIASAYDMNADLFLNSLIGKIGIGLECTGADNPMDINAKYLLEKSLSKDITVGISVTALRYDNLPVDGRELKILPDVSAYIVLPL